MNFKQKVLRTFYLPSTWKIVVTPSEVKLLTLSYVIFFLGNKKAIILSGSMAEGLFLPIYKCGYLLTSADYDQLFVDYEFTIHSQKEQCRPTDPSSLHIQSSQYPGYCQVKYCFREKLASSMIIRLNMAIATKEGSFYPKTIINTIVEELEEDTRSVAMTMHQLLTPILGQGFYLSSDLVPAIEYSE